jgi:hypothetical protein
MSLLNRIPIEEVLAAAHLLWADKAFADKMAFEAVHIINQTYKRKFAFYNGKKSRCLVGGLFYLLGYRFDRVKSQNELADCLGTTDISVRISYRKWLEMFPDLFTDVIGKMSAHKDLRYFIWIDLKKSMLKSEAGKDPKTLVAL